MRRPAAYATWLTALLFVAAAGTAARADVVLEEYSFDVDLEGWTFFDGTGGRYAHSFALRRDVGDGNPAPGACIRGDYDFLSRGGPPAWFGGEHVIAGVAGGTLSFDWRAASAYGGPGVTNFALVILRASDRVELYREYLLLGGTTDSGWRSFATAELGALLGGGYTGGDIIVSFQLNDSWTANWTQSICFDNVLLQTVCDSGADGDSCTTGGTAGQCRAGSCCTGCWNGSACVAGTVTTMCGAGGELCASCVDTLLCTDESCTAGACVAPPAIGIACDDGRYCTVDDTCSFAGLCDGSARVCDDGLGCTTDHCDELAASCIPSVDPASCVIDSVCVSDDTESLTNSCLSCQSALSTSAWSPVAAGVPCDDGGFCTTSDACDGVGACTGAARNCGDASACTTDSCDESTDSCSSAIDSTSCLIGGTCYADGERSTTNDCAACDSARSATSWSLLDAGVRCDDGGFCTVDDACDGAGVCGGVVRDCGDAFACTTDSCDESTDRCASVLDGASCVIAGVCTTAGEAALTNACVVCDPVRTTTGWSPVGAGVSCDDAGFCTVGDACDGAGACAGAARDCGDGFSCTTDSCDESTDSCASSIDSAACVIEGACYADGESSPLGDCVVCDPARSSTEWSFALEGASCDDGEACTLDACDAAGSCASTARDCDDDLDCTADSCDAAGECAHEVALDTCVIDGACIATSTPRDGAPCEACRPAASTSAWSPVDEGQLCGAPSCAGGLFTGAATCDDAALCVTSAAVPCATGVCEDDVACLASACTSDTDCPAAEYCDAVTCQPDLADGLPCDRGAACTGGLCAAGVCATPPPPGDESGGCGCRTAGNSGSSDLALLLLAIGSLALGRHRTRPARGLPRR